MRILGVDPGLTRCGIGVIDTAPGRQVTLVEAGVVRTPADLAPHLRLLAIAEGLDEWMERHHPGAIAVERVFAQSNVRSVTGTAQVAGLAMLAAARARLSLGLHTPSEVKAAVTGDGRAQKAQVQEMVRRILRLETAPKPADAADALALAICHSWRAGAAVPTASGRAVIAGQHGGAGGGTDAATPGLTAAQRAWAAAERSARRAGAVAERS